MTHSPLLIALFIVFGFYYSGILNTKILRDRDLLIYYFYHLLLKDELNVINFNHKFCRDRMDVRPQKSSSTHDDDGFESLNGNGSSDNPEEDILTGSTVTSQMSESTSAEQSSSTPKHNQLIEKIDTNATFVAKKNDDLTIKSISTQKRCLRFKKTPLSTKASIVDLDRRLSGLICLINKEFEILHKFTKLIYFLAFQSSTFFQYAVNSESEDSEQEIENESSICPKVISLFYTDINILSWN